MTAVPLPLLPAGPPVHPALAELHPAVAEWFRRRFPEGPPRRRREAGRTSRRGHDTLIAAPTGSGKTLAGFLCRIDRLYRAHERGRGRRRRTRVVYVSPLKALAVDIAENLERPLAEIAAVAAELGLDAPEHAGRGAHRRHHQLAARRDAAPAAELRRHHARVALPARHQREGARRCCARSRRSSSTRSTPSRATSAARTSRSPSNGSRRCATQRPARVGLSATQRPIETVGRLLVGDRPLPADRRRRPPARPRPRARAARGRARGGHVGRADGRRARPHRRRSSREHRTTLVFVNTRRLAERLAHQLGERLGDDVVAAHHGSPVEGPPPPGRDPPARRRPAGAGRHRVARARHRHRPGRARVPDRLAAQHRHVPAARRPLEPQPRRHAEGSAVPADARRAGRVHRAARRGARRPARRHPAAAAAARHRRPADRRRGRRAGVDAPTTSSRSCAAPRRTTS